MNRGQVTLLPSSSECIGAGVVPHVCAVAAKFPKFNVVAMSGSAILEDEDKFVAAAIERAHPAIVLHPNADIQQLPKGNLAGFAGLSDMSPIHTDVMDGTAGAISGKPLKNL